MPIDPSLLKGLGSPQEWSVGGVGQLDGTPVQAPTTGKSFASVLGSLESAQTQAATAARSLADGTATDPTQAVVAVERAQLSMQLAAQLRTKGVEALQEILHTQV